MKADIRIGKLLLCKKTLSLGKLTRFTAVNFFSRKYPAILFPKQNHFQIPIEEKPFLDGVLL
jgi:hypothetical protein